MWDKITSSSFIDALSNPNITKKSSSIGHEEVENSLESIQYMTEERLYNDLGQQFASSSSGVFNATTDTNTTSKEDLDHDGEDSDPDDTLVDKSEATSSDHTQQHFKRTMVTEYSLGVRNSMNVPSSLVWKRKITSPRWKSLSCPSIMGVMRYENQIEFMSKESEPTFNPADDEVISDSEDESDGVEDVNSEREIHLKTKVNPNIKGQSALRDNDIDFLYRRSFIDTSTYSMFSSEDSGTDENYPDHHSEVSDYSFTESSSRVSGSSDYLLMPPLPSERDATRRPMLGPPPVTLLRRSPGVVGMSSLAQKTDAELEALMLQTSQKKRPQDFQPDENSRLHWPCVMFASSESPVLKSSEASTEEFDIPYMDDTDSDEEVILCPNNIEKKLFNFPMKRAEMDDCSLDVLTEDSGPDKNTMSGKRLKTISPHKHIRKKKSCTRPQFYEND